MRNHSRFNGGSGSSDDSLPLPDEVGVNNEVFLRAINEDRPKGVADSTEEKHYGIFYYKELSGRISVSKHPRKSVAELDYRLNPQTEGRGVMTKSVQTVVGLAFAELGCERVEVVAESSDLVKQSVARRLKFSEAEEDSNGVKTFYLDKDSSNE